MSGETTCECVPAINETLKAHGVELDLAMNLTKGTARPHIAVRMLNGKRGKPPILTCTFCPFCGVSAERGGT